MKPILIHCHIFHTQMWNELRDCIKNVAIYPSDLYVTMIEEHPDIREDILQLFPKAHIEIVEGRGFDVGPFIHVINHINLDKYSYIVKLHTKRDLPKDDNGFRNMHSDIWRKNLLLPFQNKNTFQQYVENFEKFPNVGMQGYYQLFIKSSLLYAKAYDCDTYKNFQSFLTKHGLKKIDFQYLGGTMFIARAELFKYLQNLNISLQDFSPSNRKEKGDLAHIFERFFGYIVYVQGYVLRDTLVSEETEIKFQKREQIKQIFLRIQRLLYQKKVSKSNKIIIKILKIPVLQIHTKSNGRTHIYLCGLKLISFKKHLKNVRRPRPHVKPILIPRNPSIPKGVIYTCITGKYDNLIQHNCVNKNFDYVCFTDNPELLKQKNVGIWQIRPLVFDKLDSTRNNRWHKTHPHVLFPEYDLSIYLDSNIDVLSNKLFDTIDIHKNLQIPRHFERDCIYDECQRVIDCKKDSPENVRKILDFLKKNYMPNHYGLTENCILIRHHNNPQIKKIMDEWWDFIENYTKRDQLSFAYVLWKNGMKIEDVVFENARFDYKNYYFESHIPEKLST